MAENKWQKMERDITVTLTLRVATDWRNGPSNEEILGAINLLLTGSDEIVRTGDILISGDRWAVISLQGEIK